MVQWDQEKKIEKDGKANKKINKRGEWKGREREREEVK